MKAQEYSKRALRGAPQTDVVLITDMAFLATAVARCIMPIHLGLETICEQLDELRGIYGESWRPAQLLTKLAESKQSFSHRDREQAL
jgi:hypothetical protein